MNIMTMKWIDFIGGLFLTTVLSPFAWLLRRLRPRRPLPHDAPVSILFIKMMGIGSLLLASPAVRAVRAGFPNAKLHLLTFHGNRHMADNLQLFDRVFGLKTDSPWTFLRDSMAFIFSSWRTGYAVVFDFEFFSKFSILMAWFTLARRVVGFRSPLVYRGTLLTDPVYFNHYRKVSENFVSQVRVLGIESANLALSPMRYTPADMSAVQAFLQKNAIPARAQLFLVNVNAGDLCLERRWPAPYFRELVERLTKRYPEAWFLFVGSPKEKAYVAEVLAPMGNRARVVDAAGLTLGEMAALMTQSALLISNDSGPLHFAEAAQLPTVSFFGPAPMDMFSPAGPLHKVLHARVECSPCLNYYGLTRPICNGDNICMKYILSVQAEEAVVAHLQRLEATK